MTKAFGMEAPSNLKLLYGGGLVVGEAYDPFNSNPKGSGGGVGGGGAFNPFGFVPAGLIRTLEMEERFLPSRTVITLISFKYTQWRGGGLKY